MLKMIKIKRGLIVLILILAFLPACSFVNNRKVESRQGYLSSDKLMMIEGNPFFPIGICSVNPPSAFKEIKEAGFNTVHTYETKKDYLRDYVKRAEVVGLKILIYPGDYIGNPKFDIDNVKDIVRDLAGSSSILAWFLCDEPDLKNISPGLLIKIMNMVHELDSFHPVAISLAGKKFDDYAQASDIFWIPSYPVPRKLLVDVAQTVGTARKALGDKKPIWAALQAFGYQSQKNKAWGYEREPTYQEMRAMTYLAIVRGVQGIFYYTYHGSQYFIKDSPVHWRRLKSIVNELNLIYPILISPEKKEFMLSLSIAEEKHHFLFWSARDVRHGNKVIQAGTYLLVVNGANRRVMGTFAIDQLQCSKIKVIFEDREIISDDGKFSDFFGPYDIRIYYFKE